MKLKDGFVTYETEDTQIVVPVGENSFSGLIRCNETAAFIVEHIKEETTKEAVCNALVKEYGIGKDLAEKDVEKILAQLREIGALDE